MCDCDLELAHSVTSKKEYYDPAIDSKDGEKKKRRAGNMNIFSNLPYAAAHE